VNISAQDLTHNSQTWLCNKQHVCKHWRNIGQRLNKCKTNQTMLQVAYFTFESSIRPSIYFSSIVKSHSNPFLEPTSTKQ